jgi:hypothetical protein
MAKGGPKTTGALPKTGAPATASAASKPPSVNTPAAKMAGQKVATSGHPADPVGDICLLPDIARFAH